MNHPSRQTPPIHATIPITINPTVFMGHEKGSILVTHPKREMPSRVWFMAKGCKQVPMESTGGKILWAHPDGYFLNAYGRKVLHAYSPAKHSGIRKSVNGISGSCYPYMRSYGNKTCHFLMCVTFHGPRPLGYECDHINGNKLDYRPCNLQWVTPKENRRRAKIMRAIRSIGRNPAEMSTEELLRIYATYTTCDPLAYAAEEPHRDFDPFIERE